MPQTPRNTASLASLTVRALALGASEATHSAPTVLVIEERFADMCAAPVRCPNYGLAPGCPPHAIRPHLFKEQLRQVQHMLVFQIKAPATDLQGSRRLGIARKIHTIAATIEQEACQHGWSQARGLAAGSCKELFCADLPRCPVLQRTGVCLHPDKARPSLSAMGINFSLLARAVGWQANILGQPQGGNRSPEIGMMVGLVLLAQ